MSSEPSSIAETASNAGTIARIQALVAWLQREVSPGETRGSEPAGSTDDPANWLADLLDLLNTTLDALHESERNAQDLRATGRLLRASNERAEIIARATNDIVWDWDLLNDMFWWSGNISAALGYDETTLDSGEDRWRTAVHPDDYERVISGLHRVTESGAPMWQDEYRFRHGNGSYVTMLDRGFVVRDKAGKVTRMIGTMMNTSALRQAELADVHSLHATQQRLLVEFAQEALARRDLDAIMKTAMAVVSKGIAVEFCLALKIASDRDSLVAKAGRGWTENSVDRGMKISDADARERFGLILRGGEPVVVADFADERRFPCPAILREHGIAAAAELTIGGPSGVYGILGAYSRDRHAFTPEKIDFLRSVATTLGTAVERVRSDEKVAYLAQFDALTGLPNRNLIHDRIAQTLTQAERDNLQAAVLCIGLDRFKMVNDTYGHRVGDTLLMLAARRLGDCVRSGDTVGRLGADEFSIVLSNLETADEANVVAQKILAELAHPFKLDLHETFVTASVGIALYPGDGNEPGLLLKNADIAKFRAKEHGGNNFQFFTQALNARVTHRINLERELRRALDRQEFELHYQAQVSLDSGRIVAAEALVRWRHPQRGLLAPAEFIDIAEESGLMPALGQWVVDTACTQAKEWQRNGHGELAVAVNVSPSQIHRGNVAEQIRTALERVGMKPQSLVVEIAESMAMDSAESYLNTLRALKDLGVMISIDDFGTGYSNLSYLKRFPIDTLKIDRFFIRDIVSDTDDAAIVRAIIAMAHQLQLHVVAQGVETEAQVEFLRRNHIDLVQGFLFAPALDAVAFGHLLDTHMARPLSTAPPDTSRALLLVDDEENILRALKRTLRRDGYDIYTANSAREALQVLAQTQVGVVVSDERMPEMNGSEFLRRVKELYPDTVRIMLSGYTDLKTVTAAVNEGAIYKFLTKPWEDEALREDIRQAFRRQQDMHSGHAAAGDSKATV